MQENELLWQLNAGKDNLQRSIKREILRNSGQMMMQVEANAVAASYKCQAFPG